MPDISNLIPFPNIERNIKFYTFIPRINLPNYSEYMYGKIEYDDTDIIVNVLYNYHHVNRVRHTIDNKDIHLFDSENNLYIHSKTNILLEYIDNQVKIHGKFSIEDDGEHKVSSLNYSDMMLAYKYNLLTDMQYFIIDGKFRLDVICIKGNINLYLDLFSGYIFMLCDLIPKVPDGRSLITPAVMFKIDNLSDGFNLLSFEDYFDTAEYGFKINENVYSLTGKILNVDQKMILY
jgi:hypothetical protein